MFGNSKISFPYFVWSLDPDSKQFCGWYNPWTKDSLILSNHGISYQSSSGLTWDDASRIMGLTADNDVTFASYNLNDIFHALRLYPRQEPSSHPV